MVEVNGSDWKLFKKLLPIWQNRHMQDLLSHYQDIINGKGQPVDKFWALEKNINHDKRHKGVICQLSRSCMLNNIMDMLDEKAITFDDLKDFSENFQILVKNLYGIY